jgi:hypothetical protein
MYELDLPLYLQMIFYSSKSLLLYTILIGYKVLNLSNHTHQ